MEGESPTGEGAIPVGGREVQFDVPSGWEVIWQAVPRTTSAPETSIEEMVRRSLENPIGSGRIRDLADPDSKVAILVDDDTRPTPVKVSPWRA
jgi:nickel-dependent lactate racemase